MQDIQVATEHVKTIEDAYRIWYEKNRRKDQAARPELVRSLGPDSRKTAFYGVPKDFVRELHAMNIPIEFLRIFL